MHTGQTYMALTLPTLNYSIAILHVTLPRKAKDSAFAADANLLHSPANPYLYMNYSAACLLPIRREKVVVVVHNKYYFDDGGTFGSSSTPSLLLTKQQLLPTLFLLFLLLFPILLPLLHNTFGRKPNFITADPA